MGPAGGRGAGPERLHLPPAPAQYGGVAAFSPEVWATVEQRRQAFAARRDVLVEGLRAAGFGVPVMPQGAFYIYARSDALDPDSMCLARRLLDEAGVAAVPGCDFGDHQPEAHMRSPTRPPSTRSEKASAA